MGLLGNLIEPNPNNGLLNLGLNLARAGGSGQPFMGGLAQSIQQTQGDTIKYREYQRQQMMQRLRDQTIEGISDPDLKMLATLDPDGSTVAQIMAAKLKAERGWDGRDRSPYFQYIATRDGIYRFNARTGEMDLAPLRNGDGTNMTEGDVIAAGGVSADGSTTAGTGAANTPGNSMPSVARNKVLTKQTDPVLAEEMSAAEAEGASTGKALGDAKNLLADYESTYPEVAQTINSLRKITDDASYMLLQRGRDIFFREIGLGHTDAGVARTQYENTVRNVLYPQLRLTFGAQFTEKEGERLMGILGDLNKTPAERQAALETYIAQQVRTIRSLRKRTGRNAEDGVALDVDADGAPVSNQIPRSSSVPLANNSILDAVRAEKARRKAEADAMGVR